MAVNKRAGIISGSFTIIKILITWDKPFLLQKRHNL